MMLPLMINSNNFAVTATKVTMTEKFIESCNRTVPDNIVC